MTGRSTPHHVATSPRRHVTCGFTLVEATVVGLLISVVLGTMMLTFLSSQRSYTSTDAYLQVQEESRRAMDAMRKELRGAGGTIVTAANQMQFQQNLGYNLAAPCPVDAICWGTQDNAKTNQAGWSVRYRLSGTQLLREILDPGGVVQAGTRVLANSVSQASFTYVAGNTKTITVQLTTRRASTQLAGGSMSTGTTPLITAIRLRN